MTHISVNGIPIKIDRPIVEDSAPKSVVTESAVTDDGRLEWAGVYRTESVRLVRLAAVLVGPDDAADLVSEAVTRAVLSRSWGRVENQAGYLTRVVVNEAKRWRWRRTRQLLREQTFTALRRQSNDSTPTAKDSEHPELLAALVDLSPQQQAVTVLTYWDDLSIEQVADRLGITSGTVRRHLARARASLRKVL
jgi:RNA polymerase sigma factor (sigma-70 family)